MQRFNVSMKDCLVSNSSQGNILKWNIGNKYIKTSSFNQFNQIWLYESYSELIVSKLCKELGITNFVEYKPCIIVIDNNIETVGCYSENFCNESESYVSIAKLLKMGNIRNTFSLNGYQGYAELISCIQQMTDINIKQYIDTIIELDYITLNRDRHLGNFGFVYNKETSKIRLAPIFDNGDSLFATSDVSQFNYDDSLVNYVKAKPFIFKHDLQLQLIGNRQFTSRKIQNTLRYVDSLQQIGLDKHRAEFIKQLLKSRTQ